ncbi:diacylglycerol/lipid kinase family protein [Ancylomarina longa]|uniref:Diacylglycerol kinase family lipid kinase n=1 Tax=Ancylomarina longa TaxID=2487017 RepID=A0A434AXF8_9BACT|nr:diacylglycerol kinase family protein [Ancylomarina longa]RUT79183.1 diacylglycerol kinase family lipid kinase [Ancylomarina longa]
MPQVLKLLVIINPVSGTGKQKGIEKLLNQYLNPARFALDIRYTQYAKHGMELAKEAIAESFDAVLAVGGDGTVNEIASILTGTDVALGILPCGSGNGLARHLGIPMNLKKAIAWINKARIIKMDTVKANQYIFVNMGGIGFDAFISNKFENMKGRGFWNYARAVLQSFFTYPMQNFTIIENHQEHHHRGFLLSFANSDQFGNNAFIAPSANIQDGILNLVLLQKPKWYQIPLLAFQVFTKRIEKSPLFSQVKGSEFRIIQENTLAHLDGEPIELGQEIHLQVWAKSLKVFKV